MSFALDANVLVYASNAGDHAHEPARDLVERTAAGPDIAYLFWPVLMGYLRIVTHAAILPHPLAPGEATRNVSSLIDRPHIRSPGEDASFWSVFDAVGGKEVRGNDVPDAHLVALMRQHGVGVLYTRDRGFRRFRGIEVRDPVEDAD